MVGTKIDGLRAAQANKKPTIKPPKAKHGSVKPTLREQLLEDRVLAQMEDTKLYCHKQVVFFSQDIDSLVEAYERLSRRLTIAMLLAVGAWATIILTWVFGSATITLGA